mgnify:CR=1 FL=1
MIKAVRHTGIVVRNLRKSTKFYSELGFIEDNRAIEEGDFIDKVVGMKNTKLAWVKLKAPDGYLLELLQYESHPEEKEISNQKSNQLGCSHLAFSVDKIEVFCEKIKKLGGNIVNLPALTNNKNIKVAYCHDNEGNLMEVVEILCN